MFMICSVCRIFHGSAFSTVGSSSIAEHGQGDADVRSCGSHREATAAPQSGELSLSSANERQNDVGERLRRALVGERRMSVAEKADKAVAAKAMPSGTTSGTSQLLLGHHLKQLKQPTILRKYDKVAREAARGGIDHAAYLPQAWVRLWWSIASARSPASRFI
jgi:hypothetical protein